ncbi:ATP-dependent DNA helicase [Candidatus Woesearchaeota archaeon]|nr:ATP-dependent DNA helicase [Candidatus Woesearchaeota archaeon]
MTENQSNEDKYLFPYDKLRPVQNELILEVAKAISERKNVVVHAPTGLGKTAATLGPALKYALDNKKKVFFLTSRHTQHIIAIETLKDIKKKHDVDFIAVDMIGKKWMCTVPHTDKMMSNEFYEYCKKQREDNLCEMFTNTKKGTKLTTESKLALEGLRKENPCHIERFTDLCGNDDLCAYELASELAKEATVIVADYYYIYNPRIRDAFLNRLQLSLKDCIVITDEGHNLPDRIRNLMTTQLSNYMIKRGVNEAKNIKDHRILPTLVAIQDVLNELSNGLNDGDEKTVEKAEFIEMIEKIGDYDEIIADIDLAAQEVKQKEKQSSLGGISSFLEEWQSADKGYAKIISQTKTRRESVVALKHHCLDPSISSGITISECHSTIIMSGTLTPTSMYKDILGFPDNTIQKRYPSPFPEKNRLSMIVPETTTKFSMRNPKQYNRIAEICSEITNLVDGNSAVFFPSYYLRDEVYRQFSSLSRKTTFLEVSEMSKEEKSVFLEKFKSYKKTGAVLMGVMAGSFGEGVDLPGDLLKCVVIVGLPLQRPSLETKELIKYYDDKFNKGWDYGYVGPAFSKCLQSAGRCIRSEEDRGIIVFLDERYSWQNYYKHFPADWEIKTTKLYKDRISEFLGLNR